MEQIDLAPLLQYDAVNAPNDISFVLADNTVVNISENEEHITVQAKDDPRLLSFKKSSRTLISSVPGLLNADREETQPVYVLSPLTLDANLTSRDLWVALYAFWLRRTAFERLPVQLDFPSEENAKSLSSYIVHSGLGYVAPQASSPFDLIIVRAAFWQGAGAPEELNWLRYVDPPFPLVTSFTRGPNIVTTHPLRPPKPPPGQILYRRYIASVNQTLSLIHINGSDPSHFEKYKTWQNSERVNVGWKERGPDEKHKTYIAEKLADPHSMGLMVAWDDELAGYAEMAWVKEDHMNSFVGGLGEYDQGTHYLAGEEKFRGRHRFTAVMTSLKHCCFLRDPRTSVVVGEPRFDLPIIPRLIAFLPQEFNREFEMPHKRAVYFVLRRERFFQAATLY